MHVVTTNTGGWIEGSNTEVRVEFEDEAKAEAERWSGPGENMVDGCVWRLLHERWDEVTGASVSFRLNRQDVLGLIDRLKSHDANSMN